MTYNYNTYVCEALYRSKQKYMYHSQQLSSKYGEIHASVQNEMACHIICE